MEDVHRRLPRWYFGGCASAMAACVTHPLDLLKVLLQTQTDRNASIVTTTLNVIKQNGILSLYNGISASIFRQLTYSMTRFGIYDAGKKAMGAKDSFAANVAMASFAGAAGGFVGTPPDMINVRMQNDVRLPPDKRRNYKHVIDGLMRVLKEEGMYKMFAGGTIATTRAIFMTVGQLSFYDLFKGMLLASGFEDGTETHFLASFGAGGVATGITQPLDVLKTKAMNAKHGEFKSTMDIVTQTAKHGPLGFFKGFIPAFVRIGPHTILTFIFLEQLRLHFGYLPAKK